MLTRTNHVSTHTNRRRPRNVPVRLIKSETFPWHVALSRHKLRTVTCSNFSIVVILFHVSVCEVSNLTITKIIFYCVISYTELLKHLAYVTTRHERLAQNWNKNYVYFTRTLTTTFYFSFITHVWAAIFNMFKILKQL